MPAPNRTAQSPLARRLERVERPHEDERDRLARGGDLAARAGCFWLEPRWDSRIGRILIQPVGWAEASRNAEALFARLA